MDRFPRTFSLSAPLIIFRSTVLFIVNAKIEKNFNIR